ncbi:type II toxin-antitoxin system HigB family toxin [Yersinia frederiksenii]|uniref:type II toxin-antitoxin system HigB family toxin n=1 Tax=Yersinia frederiksenii TaxID=29484 RepID=UPI0005DB3373|nr:type II toxin-antitoxin system HigB family toxin [Yersinia frederiksenii]CFR11970.1 mRNA interferase HigB [Yersinia frederiksenii]
MRIIAISALTTFWAKHPETEQPLKAWIDEVKHAQWAPPCDIKAQFRSASVLKSRRVVFNIKGNDYRMITAIAYRFGAVYIKFIGSYRQYDSVDADHVELE